MFKLAAGIVVALGCLRALVGLDGGPVQRQRMGGGSSPFQTDHAMKRVALLLLKVLSIAPLALCFFEVHSWLSSVPHWSLDAFDATSQVPVIINLLADTFASAVVAGIAAVISVSLYGRFAVLASLVIALPLLHHLWPWNPIFHDFHWSAMQWAVALWESGALLFLVLLSAITAGHYLKRSNKTMEPTP